MPRLTQFPEGSQAALKAAMAKSRTKAQFRRAQCLWLRAMGMPGDQVAQIVGWSPNAVWKFSARYLAQGEAALAGPGRGGRRHSHLTFKAERALLIELAAREAPNEVIEASTVQSAYERTVGHPVSRSTVYRMLSRHGWHRAASGVALVPRTGWSRSVMKPF